MNEKEKNERNSLLKELIKMAQSDNEMREIEFEFLLAISQQMGVSKEDFKKLFEEYIEFHPPKMEHDRIVQFQRLVLMMNVDLDMDQEEFDYVRQLGLRMGLHPDAINEVLRVMHDYPNKMVPVDKLISIFKTYHN